jgi:hypothetical protein
MDVLIEDEISNAHLDRCQQRITEWGGEGECWGEFSRREGVSLH